MASKQHAMRITIEPSFFGIFNECTIDEKTYPAKERAMLMDSSNAAGLQL
jgi:hypothetical protein